jgi:hypothetical protein
MKLAVSDVMQYNLIDTVVSEEPAASLVKAV